MRKGWEAKPLESVATIVNGGTPKTNEPDYWGGHHCWITPAEMGNRLTPYVAATARTLTDMGLTSSSAKLVPQNSVILSTRAPIGHLVINSVIMATNQGCRSVIPSSQINYKYLYYYLYYSRIELDSLGTGATFKELAASKLKSFVIKFPESTEQRHIVTILDDAFERIDKTIANTEKNIANAKELFESCLEVTFTNFVDKTVSYKIKACTKFIDYRGKTPEKTDFGLRLITAKNVKKGVLQKTPEEFVSPEVYDTWMTRGIPKIGDVLFTTEAPLGNVAQLDTSEKVVFAQRIIIIQPTAKILDSKLFKYLLLSPQMQKTVDSLGTGATAKGIKAKVLKEIDITFPQALSAQLRIAVRLEQTENFCRDVGSKLLQKISALHSLKQSLLAAAFSGELTADFTPDALEL